MIKDSVLLTNGLYLGLDVLQVHVIDAREQVMFNLEVKSSCEEISPVRVDCEVVRSNDLVFEVVCVSSVHILRREMIYLSRCHEEPGNNYRRVICN